MAQKIWEYVYEIYVPYTKKNFKILATAGVLDSKAYKGVELSQGIVFDSEIRFETTDEEEYFRILRKLKELEIEYDTRIWMRDLIPRDYFKW